MKTIKEKIDKIYEIIAEKETIYSDDVKYKIRYEWNTHLLENREKIEEKLNEIDRKYWKYC